MSTFKYITLLFTFLILLALCIGCREKEVEFYGSDISVSDAQSDAVPSQSSPQTQEQSSQDTSPSEGNDSNGSVLSSTDNEPQIDVEDLIEPDGYTGSSSVKNNGSASSVSGVSSNGSSNVVENVIPSTSSDSKTEASSSESESSGNGSEEEDGSSSSTVSRDVDYDSTSGWTPIMP